ncbi:MAG: hypothetical protein U0K76_01100, partial [Dialister sp.]|nr:hypothetical protein [Dialister sp.]
MFPWVAPWWLMMRDCFGGFCFLKTADFLIIAYLRGMGNKKTASLRMKAVGLSNICYTVLDEIIECIFWRFPSKRAHWEAVIISIIISFELYSEI